MIFVFHIFILFFCIKIEIDLFDEKSKRDNRETPIHQIMKSKIVIRYIHTTMNSEWKKKKWLPLNKPQEKKTLSFMIFLLYKACIWKWKKMMRKKKKFGKYFQVDIVIYCMIYRKKKQTNKKILNERKIEFEVTVEKWEVVEILMGKRSRISFEMS